MKIAISLIVYLAIISGTVLAYAGKSLSPESKEIKSSEDKITIENISKDSITTFIVGGDMMFDRYIDYKYRDDKILEVVGSLAPSFKNYDLALVNLEGPISPTPIPADNTNSLIFNFPPKTIDALQSMGIDAVSLANNHTNNNGRAGYTSTVKVLTEAKITPIGQEVGITENSVKEFDIGGNKITVIALNVLETDQSINGLIKSVKEKGNVVIVFPHWGEEYVEIHNTSQEILAKSWIDSGADLVIGSHPHVIQDAQIMNGKPVFYSLGNLLFDQNFSVPTQRGLVLSGKIVNGKLAEISLLPTISEEYKPRFMVGDERGALFSKMQEYLKLPISADGVINLAR